MTEDGFRVVIRHLPPLLPAAILQNLLAPYRNDFRDFYHVVGDPTLGKFCYGRAYLVFTTEAAMFRFARAFDGHLFRNAAGVEHRALVERAPLPASAARGPKPSVNKREGSLEQDPAFVKFQADLANPPPPPAAPDTLTTGLESKDKGKEQLTPLVRYLQERYRARGATTAGATTTAAKPRVVQKWVCPSAICQSGTTNVMSVSACALCHTRRPKRKLVKIVVVDVATGVARPAKSRSGGREA